MKQIHDLFGDVERFVATADLSPAAKVKLQSIMNNPNQKSQLIVELAITVDAVSCHSSKPHTSLKVMVRLFSVAMKKSWL